MTLQDESFKLLVMGQDVIDTYGQLQFYQETAQFTQDCLQHQLLLLAPDRAAETSAEDAATPGTCQIPVRRQPLVQPQKHREGCGLSWGSKKCFNFHFIPQGKFPEEISDSD